DWPPELQAVMDKVLARDVNERYQKSAEFGRDIAKAVENMPAAVAAAAGTMVMGAPAAELPKTRMATKGGATTKIEVPAPVPVVAAPAKKSPVMMIVAAVVVIGAIGGGVLFLQKPGGAPKSDAPVANAPANTPTTTPVDPNAGRPSGSATQQKDPVKPMSKGLSSAPTGVTPSAPPPAVTQKPGEIIDYWLNIVSDPNANEKNGKEALAAIEPLLPKLSGQEKSNALYAQFFIYGIAGNAVLECKAAREIVATDAKETHK